MSPSEVSQLLISADSARDFLARYIEAKKSRRKAFGYAEIARSAGIASRSSVRDFILGRRSLTLTASKKICAGLRLNQVQSRYFELLALSENPSGQNPQELKHQLELLRKKLTGQTKKVVTLNSPKAPHLALEWIYVYSSLGDENTGRSAVQVSNKSKVPVVKAEKILSQLEKLGVVHHQVLDGQKAYFPTSRILNLDQLGSDVQFHESFLHSCILLTKAAEKSFTQNKDRLFFDGVFSIEQDQLLAFRQSLQQKILETMQEFESPDGEKLVTIVCGFFPRE